MKNNKWLIIGFYLSLALPILGLVFGFNDLVKLEENRNLAQLPPLGINQNFPSQFTKFLSDHFWGRSELIFANRWWRYKILGISTDKTVTIGKSGWLFYTPDVNYIDSVNGQPFSQEDLKTIKNNLEEVRNKFEKIGAKFYFIVGPNKQTIYPEYLPDYMRKINPDSRLGQLTNYLKDADFFINPSTELKSSQEQVYLKFDTHWNDLGAKIATEKLLRIIGIQNKFDQLTQTKITAPNRDLALQIGIGNELTEKEEKLFWQNPQAITVKKDCPKIFTGCPYLINEVSNQKLPRLVMFRDSFGAAMIPLISEHFSRSYFFWGAIPLPAQIVKEEKPDIVVWELTERELWRLTGKTFEF